jgi:nucleoid DNA-binding protein
MTESELVTLTQRSLNAAGLGKFTPKQVRAVLRMAGAITAASVAAGDPAVLPNLGKLKTTLRPARPWRNPLTGATTTVPRRRIVSFAPTAALRESLVIPEYEHTS